jgi:hypothetical protein
MAMLDAALALAARGLRVFPLQVNGTRPAWEGWTETATTDAATIRAWWHGVEYNVGVCTTGMFVPDIDTKKGRPGLESWMAVGGAFDTLTVRTKSGGYHLYYSGADVANSAGDLGPGLDVRSHHGYVVGPGSAVDGEAYTIEMDLPIAPAPAAIVARCKAPGVRAENAGVPLVDLDSPAALALATALVTSTEAAGAGTRSDAAYRLACAVRDLGVSEPMTAALLQPWADRSGIPAGDIEPIVTNAYAYAQNQAGAKHPLAVFGEVSLPDVPDAPPSRPAPSQAVAFGNLIALGDLKPRDWLLHRLLLRKDITALVAPGGVGKSLLQLVIAVHLALGLDLWGYKNRTGRWWKSIIYNAEDGLPEMSMRLYAVCTALGLDANLAASRIALISGRSHMKLRLVQGGQQPAINKEAVAWLMNAARDPEVAMLGMDPVNKLHTVNGNDNVLMTFVMETIEAIAEEADVAVLLSHHTSKPSGTTRGAGNADASQGARAIVDSARIVLTMMPPDDQDCAHYGLTAQERKMLVRLDDAKANRTLMHEEATWLRKVPVKLWMGEEVGALDRADMHIRTEHMKQLIARVLHVGMMHQRGSAGVTLTDAALLLRDGDPMFEKMPRDLLRSRIQQYLAQPVTLPDGSTLGVQEDGKRMMVVLT